MNRQILFSGTLVFQSYWVRIAAGTQIILWFFVVFLSPSYLTGIKTYPNNKLQRTIATERPPLSGEVSANLVSVTDPLRPYSRISRLELLLFLPSSSSVVLTRLSGSRSRPILRKSGSVGNRTRTSGSVARNSDH
jgi:hypothetical protein